MVWETLVKLCRDFKGSSWRFEAIRVHCSWGSIDHIPWQIRIGQSHEEAKPSSNKITSIDWNRHTTESIIWNTPNNVVDRLDICIDRLSPIDQWSKLTTKASYRRKHIHRSKTRINRWDPHVMTWNFFFLVLVWLFSQKCPLSINTY